MPDHIGLEIIELLEENARMSESLLRLSEKYRAMMIDTWGELEVPSPRHLGNEVPVSLKVISNEQ